MAEAQNANANADDLNEALLENIYEQVDGTQQQAIPAYLADGRVNTAQIKIPPFWTKDPELWFLQIEANFASAGIRADLSKYNQIVGKLNTDILTAVSDLVKNPPATNKYLALKNRLIHEFKESDRKKLKTLFNDLNLNEGKPSELLRRMKDKSCNKVGNDLLLELWTNRLPQQTQAILSCCNDPLDQQVILADKIHETMDPNSIQVLSKSHQPSDSDFKIQFCKLEDKIDSLQKEINKSRSRTSSFNRNRSPYRSPTRSNQKPSTWCWYHRRYLDKAINCDPKMDPPCTFNKSKNPKYTKN